MIANNSDLHDNVERYLPMRGSTHQDASSQTDSGVIHGSEDVEYLLMREAFVLHLNSSHSNMDCPCAKCYELSKQIKKLALRKFCDQL